MKYTCRTLVYAAVHTLVLTFLTTQVSLAGIEIGETAADFTLTDSNGQPHKLSDYKGKYVVLEWVNYDCPFVKKQYKPGKMQALQKQFAAKEVVWLSINSSAPGKQGHFSASKINQRIKKSGATPSAYLIDEDGKVGQLYEAKTTPHMFIIDPNQTLVYEGAIDSIPSADPSDVKEATNYVEVALNTALNGKAIKESWVAPYGCSVKY